MKRITEWELLPTVRTARFVLFACFFFSGFTGLLYELVWVRLFTQVFGNTVYSSASVLAAFMAGLGAGGWWFGRYIEKKPANAVLFYGLVELVIGVYAYAPLYLIRGFESAYPAIYNAMGGSQAALVPVKFAAAVVLIALPAFCMGATLPLLSRFFVSTHSRFAGAVSLLYGLNTLGAVTGTLMTGFLLIHYMGMRGTLFVGLVLNIGIGLLAVVQHKKLKEAEEDGEHEAIKADVDEQKQEEAIAGEPRGGGGVFLILGATFVCGFVSLLLEIAWTRGTALIIGSSTYAFTIILATFLMGMALGSFGAGRYMRRRGEAVAGTALLGLCLLLLAASSALTLPAMKWMLFAFIKALNITTTNIPIFITLQFFVCAALLLVPALFFGAAFPVAATLYARRARGVASSVGRVYLWNTFGAILGSSLTGFVMIPSLGVHGTLLFAFGVTLFAALALMLGDASIPFSKRATAAVFSIVLILFTAKTASWDRNLMSSGVFLYFKNMGSFKSLNDLIESRKKHVEILFYGDGASSTVTVSRTGENISLQVNGKTDASNYGDAHPQIFCALMPLLTRENPRDVAVIGIGSGMSAGTTLFFPSVRHVDVIEIERNVARALRYFDDFNNHVRLNPRARIHIDDGRNFFLTHDSKYDVIISEPSNPWMAGIVNLYTRDFYQLAARHLNPGGVYSQWIQFYAISPESLRMIMATFQDVFPHTYIFLVGGDMFLLGSQKPFPLDARAIAKRFDDLGIAKKIQPMRGAFTGLGIGPAHLVAGPEEVRKLSLYSSMITDDRPVLEYRAPFELFSDNERIVSFLINVHPVDVLPAVGLDPKTMAAEDYAVIAGEMMNMQPYRPEIESMLLEAIKKDPRHVKALTMLAEYYSSPRRRKDMLAGMYYRRALDAGGGKDVRYAYFTLLTRQGDYKRALEMAKPLLKDKQWRRNGELYGWLAECRRGLGQYEEAISAYIRAAALMSDPQNKSRAYLNAAEVLKKAGFQDKSQRLIFLKKSYTLLPGNPVIALEYARTLERAGRDRDALIVLTAVRREFPEIAEVNLLFMEIIQHLGWDGDSDPTLLIKKLLKGNGK